jgi:triosephosphate isomerase
MRKKLVAGNWKMNNDVAESLILAERLKVLSEDFDERIDVLICPPFTSLYSVNDALRTSGIKVGAQNMYFREEGAYTGEISPVMLKSMGIKYVIIGHSERRQYFNETDEDVNKKLKSALKHNIIPILCIGETLKEREGKREKEIIKNQIVRALENIESSDAQKLIIAYEPVWAIGTGINATSRQANEMAMNIRSCISEIYNSRLSDELKILYGGSVKADNAKEILTQSDIDGALVGGASLNAEEFFKIINYAKRGRSLYE